MTVTTTEPPVADLIDRLAAADAAYAEAETNAARERALKAAAKPATRAELKAAAHNARTELEARRAVALEEFTLLTNEVWLATEAVAEAHAALAAACTTAHKGRRRLEKLRVEIADTFGVAVARERYNVVTNDANRTALRDAVARADAAMRDLPEVPAQFGARFASRLPGVAALVKAERDAIKLPV